MNEETMQAQSAPAILTCPICGSGNVKLQLFQEDAGSTTVSKTKSVYKEKKHGLLWWLLIGWWWWIIDLILWICFFPVKLILSIIRKKKIKGKATTVSQSVKQMNYKTICLCNNCGHSWQRSEVNSNGSNYVSKNDIRNLKRIVK